MKKKIALLLAAVMTFAAAVPMNLFAATASNRMSHQITKNVKDHEYADRDTDSGTSNGSNLVMTLDTDAVVFDDTQAVRITLTNADWLYSKASLVGSGFIAAVDGDTLREAQTQANAWLAASGAPVAAAVGDNKEIFYNDGSNGGDAYVLYIESAKSAIVFFNAGDATKSIVLPLVMKGLNDSNISVNIDADNSSAAVKSEVITFGVASNTVLAVAQAVGQKTVELKAVTITERALGSIRADKDNKIVFEIPFGYKFTNETVSVQVNNSTVVNNVAVTVNDAGNEATVALPSGFDANLAASIMNKITITGLVIAPRSAADLEYDVDLFLKIKSNEIGASNGEVANAAKFLDYGVYYALADKEEVKVLEAGRINQVTAKVVISEKIANSWWTNKNTAFELVDADGKLVENVKITSVTIGGVDTKNNGAVKNWENGTYLGYFDNNNRIVTGTTKVESGERKFNPNDNTVEFNSVRSFNLVSADANVNEAVKVEVTVRLSVDSMATGDVYLQAKNSSFGLDYDDIENGGKVQIATIKPMVEISTATTEVQIGAQRYNVKDVVITELEEKALLAGGIRLALGEFGGANTTGGLRFVPLENVKNQVIVTGGDRAFELGVVTGGNSITTNVRVVSRSEASKITFTKLQAYVDRTVPNGTYELVVSGSAFKNNGEDRGTELRDVAVSGGGREVDLRAFDSFSDVAFVADGYITVATDQDNLALRNEVKIMDGVVAALVNGEEVDLPRHPEFNREQNRFYVPLTGIASILGTSRFYWDNDQRVATVLFNNKSVQFKIGSSQYWVSGEAFARSMDAAAYLRFDENGGGYTYIPFAALGDAFDIPTSFKVEEDGTIIGIYNEKN